MLFEFFLTHVLKRTLTLPISFGLVYPSVTGTVVVRSSSLTPPAAESIATRMEIPYAKVDPNWSTVRDEVIVAESVYLRDVQVVIDVTNPAEALYCLQNRACASPQSQRARLATAAPPQEIEEPSAEPLPPLKLRADSFTIEGGRLVLQREDIQVPLQIVRISGADLPLPLESNSFSVAADLLLLEPGQTSAMRPRPIRAKITWESIAQELTVALSVRDIPIARFNELVPEVTPSLARLTALTQRAVPANDAAAEPGNLDETVAGEISGELTLSYQVEEGRWRMR